MGDSSVLNIHWAYGFSKDIVGGVHSLSTKDRNALFFLSAHSGVIYDFEHRSQMILQGHCNSITCCAVSKDKRWIVTADQGEDSILVVWDSFTGAPVKTIFAPHANGCVSVDISDDALYITSLKAPCADEPQEVAVWAWTRPQPEGVTNDLPLLREVMITNEKQHDIIFNPFNQSEIATTGAKTVCFWSWEEFKLEGYVGKVSKTDFGHFSGRLTKTIFLGKSGNALTCSDEGYTILWETQYATILLDDANNGDKVMRTASKVLKLVDNTGIATMIVINDYIAVACLDGAVRYYDFFLRLESWFEDFAAGPLTSLSFSLQECPYPDGEAGSPGLQFWVPDFIVGTSEAFIVGAESALFDEIRADDRRGTLLMQGMSEEICSVACHPTNPLVSFACGNGNLHIWDYEMKILINLREFNSKKATMLNSLASDAGGAGGSASRMLKKLAGEGTEHVKASSSFLRPQCVAFEPTTGEFLAVGFSSGHIKFVSVETLEDVLSFAPSLDAILGLRFSASAMYLAAYDSSYHVMVFKRLLPDDDGYVDNGDGPSANFIYIGRILAHSAPITGLTFGFKDGRDMLVSVSEDKHCVEYDLVASSTATGVAVVGSTPNPKDSCRFRLELTAVPTAVMWHAHLDEDVEDRFVVANSEFKFKEFNAESKQCRKTTLAPTFGINGSAATAKDDSGGAPTRLFPLPLPLHQRQPGVGVTASTKASMHGIPRHYVYSTANRVIGIGCFPLTGNPEEVVGLVAHPHRISDMALSYDGKFVFTSGGSDLSVNMWEVNVQPLVNVQAQPSMEPYYGLLEEGVSTDGELYNNIVDYFYFCQIRSHGENVMDSRAITGRIPIGEISTLMRAIGYFPSEEEIVNMVDEVRYKYFMTTGNLTFDITLDDFVKLYINHRPLFPLNSNAIEDSFQIVMDYVKKAKDKKKALTNVVLTAQERFRGAPTNVGPTSNFEQFANTLDDTALESMSTLPWSDLCQLLGIEGEALNSADMMSCLTALLGENDALMMANSANKQGEVMHMNSNVFAEDILGFESSGV